MEKTNLDERLKDVMSAVFGVEPSDINEDSSQDNIEGWDSVKSLALIVSIEEEFGVSIPLEEVVNMTSYKYIKLTLEELVK